MAAYYLDSSVIIKRFRSELGSGWIRALFLNTEDKLYSSSLTILEVRSVLSRLRKNRQLSNRALEAARSRLAVEATLRLSLVPVSEEIVSIAMSSLILMDLGRQI